MMTGQMLGGSSPIVAAEYQMAILWLIFTSAALSTTTSLLLAINNAVFDQDHRLAINNILKKIDQKMDLSAYVYMLLCKAMSGTYSRLKITSVTSFGTQRYELVQRTPDDMIFRSNFHFVSNTPSHPAFHDMSFQSSTVLFEVSSMNVVSGEAALFSPEGKIC